MRFAQKENNLYFSHRGETVRIEAWGNNALRIRATRYHTFTNQNKALEEEVAHNTASIQINVQENTASITNGKIKLTINAKGVMSYFKDGKPILQEYFRNYDDSVSDESICLKLEGRMYKAIVGGDYQATLRFNANAKEHLYGMGAYQQPYLDLKGCSLELAQRNSQTSIPFVLSYL